MSRLVAVGGGCSLFLLFACVLVCALGVRSSGSGSSSKRVTASQEYRLYGKEGIKALPPLVGKPAAAILNWAGTMLRIQGPLSVAPSALLLKQSLEDACDAKGVQPNGVYASKEQRETIASITSALEACNPTSKPASSDLMNGYWRLLYTDFAPAAPSSGKLGPFVGKVYQKLDAKNNKIYNILDISLPPIKGQLEAKQSVFDSSTWAIKFEQATNSIFGIPLRPVLFPQDDANAQIRLWQITYLDANFRVMRAKKPGAVESFLFVLKRVEE